MHTRTDGRGHEDMPHTQTELIEPRCLMGT